ncbi:DMT family transporter [Alisedimentitalea sp. MJ-SS2]|uniref:DMT family transporter n=1 Tax=Aliisedimentitalea sp. MJ-SS2 TaxID=3049795 RepID=UPI00290B2E83|nr:DMT family transporter [Alisedimentitalea sp. MJ-SS2]MDU8927170.1 DMT family transporter [Alisedimentitalea sp. MJ-SS2]
MNDTPEITARSWLMILTLGLVWGGTFMFQSLALRTTPPFWVATARIGFAMVLTFLVWRWRGGRLFTTANTDYPRLIAVSVLSSAIPFMFLSWGQQYVTSAFAGVSMATVALFVLPLAHVLVPGERMTLRRSLGFVMGFAGVLILLGPEVFQSSGDDREVWGRLACFSAAFCYAISSIMIRRLPPIDPFGLTFATLGFGLLLVLPVATLAHGAPPNPGSQGLMILALLGLVPTAGANLLRILTIRSAGPVFMSLTNYLVPLFAVLLGATFLSEPLPNSLITAMALILCGVGLSQFGALRRLFAGRT